MTLPTPSTPASSSLARGWFSLAFSRDLAPGQVLPRRFMGEDLVVFRTTSGRIAVLDAHCPHLGAHMGHGGTVEGETLRCHFHGFCFDAAGTCTKTGYGTKPPPAARARAWSVGERGGVVLAWYDPTGAAPTWEVPEVETAPDWYAPAPCEWHFPGSSEDIAENAVDLGHLSVTHGYGDPQPTADLLIDGPLLRAAYRFRRKNPLGGGHVDVAIVIHQHGVGFARVDSHVEQLGLQTRLLVTSGAEEPGRVALRCTVSMRRLERSSAIHPALGFLPASFLGAIVRRSVVSGFRHDVDQDVPIWTHKRHLASPALAAGDGPVGKYRKWIRQFWGPPTGSRAANDVEAA